jgi:hypothetical protein
MSDDIKRESGEKRVFSTGAKRQASAGKGMPSLMPGDALIDIAKHFEKGAVVHGGRNWEKGLPLSSILDSLERHLQQEKMGETDEPHARALAWNAMVYLATKLRIEKGILPPELADMPSYEVDLSGMPESPVGKLLIANKPIAAGQPVQYVEPIVTEKLDGSLTEMPKLEPPIVELSDENVVTGLKPRTAAEQEAVDINLALPVKHPDREFFCSVTHCFTRGKPNADGFTYYCPKHTTVKEKGPEYV